MMVKHIPTDPADPAVPEEDVIYEEAPRTASDDVVHEDEAPEKGLPPRAQRQGDGSYILPLRVPVVLHVQRAGQAVQNRSFSEVRFYRMTGADLMAVTASSSETSLATAFTRSSRLNPAVATKLFQKMDGADAADASTIIGFFFGGGAKTGR